MEYKIKGSDEWKQEELWVYSLNRLENSHWLNIGPEVENENPVCIKWDHVDQWRELSQVTEVSDQKHVALLISEQEQVKEVIDVKKKK